MTGTGPGPGIGARTGPFAMPSGVFTIPAGVPFVDALARGLTAASGPAPEALAAVTVLLPNRRACRALADAFLRQVHPTALLLPAILPIGDVDADDGLDAGDLALPDTLDIPPSIPELRRQLLLAQLVLARDGALRVTDAARAADLAAELARLLDQVETEGIGFDALDGLVPETLSEHWQVTLEFLRILTEHWPSVLEAEGALDPAERRNRLIESRIETWRRAPPAGPVIIAGSTGSIPATRRMMRCVAGLANGAVILPGLDRALEAETWDRLDAGHPQYGLKLVLEALDTPPAAVAVWPGIAPSPVAVARAGLLRTAMRPAGVAPGRLEDEVLRRATTDVCRIDCAGAHEEASTIALLLREALETDGGTAALVTPDRGLARRVAAELRRWDIEIDDSGGTGLALTPVGAFLRLVAGFPAERWAPVPLLSALKHPLAGGGLPTGVFRRHVRALERAVLRGPRPEPGLDGLIKALAEAGAATPLTAWLGAVAEAVGPLDRLIARGGRAEVSALAEAHIAAAENLAAGADATGVERLWAGEDGEAAASFMAEVITASRGLAPVEGRAWPDLLETLMRGRTVRPRYGRHPRLSIWGVLEARLQSADRLVLGGLNEGTWPLEPPADPWMSRPMRADFGLPPHERRIGLAAHDFAQAFAAPEVFLTRAVRVSGTPTVPSRWLMRIANTLGGKAAEMTRGAAPWTGWQARLDRPEFIEQTRAPSPVPPVAARPRRLSVTQVETLIRDPYAIYARHVLGLKALDPIDADPGAAERGTFVHAALDAFLRAYPADLPEDAFGRLIEMGREALGTMLERPGVRAFWWPRFERIARWFLEIERTRRFGIARTLTEVTGRLEFDAPGGKFILSAKADRIDVLEDGAIAIVDYKTGVLPPKKEIAAGVAPQLPLEAAIVEAGGFSGVAEVPVIDLSYWRLSGGEPPGQILSIGEAPETLAVEARAGLERLIAAFDDPATPYLPQPDPARAPRYGDYDHLERLAEYAPGRTAGRRR